MNQTNFLDSLIVNIYQKAFNRGLLNNLPITYIDEPEIAQTILRNSEIFQKNYSFLESLSVGRLSTNGDEWKKRASLTQPFFAKYEERINEKQIKEIYSKHLKKFFNSGSEDLFQCFIDAAMEVIFIVFALPPNTAWPTATLHQIRGLLNLQQATAWGYGPSSQFSIYQKQLEQLCNEIGHIWSQDAQMAQFLHSLKKKAGFSQFDPVKELVQVFQAASETTASTLLWTVECLLRHPGARLNLIKSGSEERRDLFTKEVLRLFPPLPFVTRVCVQDFEQEKFNFKQGEVILVSIIGLHCHPTYWSSPVEFNTERPEFLNNSFQKSAYIPFLSGPRSCGGMRLANQELHSALDAILHLCKFGEYQEAVKIDYGITSRPGNRLEKYLSMR
jgi:cytochrome P450